jgi:hypothetical protein
MADDKAPTAGEIIEAAAKQRQPGWYDIYTTHGGVKADGVWFRNVDAELAALGPTAYATLSDPMTLRDVVGEALEAFGEEFDNDTEINGGDLVEWFAEWREMAKAVVAAEVST